MNKDNDLPFASTPIETSVKPGVINEVSGITDSKLNAGYLWLHEDSGNPPQIGLLKWDGNFLKKIYLKGAVNRDWEDMALATGPIANTNYLYIADIGDNNEQLNEYFIYRFTEPSAKTDTVYNYDKIIFQYPDGSHDAEAILVDNSTKDIFIITKRDAQSKIYKLQYPQKLTTVNTASFVTNLSFTGVVSAAASPDGKELILKTYTSIYYWQVNSGQNIEQTLQKTPKHLPYKIEPQGEAIAFKNDNTGFIALSEIGSSTGVFLQFYKRL